VGYLVGGWASDRYGRWNTWLGAGSLLALMALLIAFCPYVPLLFDAGILIYIILAGCCLTAFWAIVVQAVSPRLAITKITLLSMLIGVAEALLSLICIGVAILLKRRLRRSGPKEFSSGVPTN
jgi:MFS family permease